MTTTATTGTGAGQGESVRLPRHAQKFELVDGHIRVSPVGARHGCVCVRLITVLSSYVQPRRLGHVFDSSTGFRLPGGNIRLPDVSFVARGWFPGDRLPEGSPDLAPDLAIEVLSPDDRPRPLLDKVGEYLQAGVRVVWLIDPQRRKAAVYRSVTDVLTVGPEDMLDGECVIPGFRCRLADVLD